MQKIFNILEHLFAKKNTREKQLQAITHWSYWNYDEEVTIIKNLKEEIKNIDKKIHGVFQMGLTKYGEEFETKLLDIFFCENWQKPKGGKL